MSSRNSAMSASCVWCGARLLLTFASPAEPSYVAYVASLSRAYSRSAWWWGWTPAGDASVPTDLFLILLLLVPMVRGAHPRRMKRLTIVD